MYAIVLLFCFVAVSGTSNTVCYRGRKNATISISSEAENNLWAFGVSDINITVYISCTEYFRDDEYLFYFLKSGENPNNVEYFLYIYIWDKNYIDVYNRGGTLRTTSAKVNDALNEIQVNISLTNLTIADNLSRLAINHYYTNDFFYSQPFIFVDCPAPISVISNYNPSLSYTYLDVIRATCRKNLLFIDGFYQNGMDVTCGRYAKWEIPEHECDVGCSNPDNGLIQAFPKMSTSKYKVNTRLLVFCSNGRVFSSDQPTVFIQSIVCQSNGEWDHANIDCWQDQIVDFKSSEQTLVSGRKTVFACEPTVGSHKVRTTVDKTVLSNWEATWWITAPDSKLNGITAICEVIDNNEIVVKKHSTLLNVLHTPELLHNDGNPRFGLDEHKSGRVIIEISSNPILSFSDIKITKNGTQIPNYYMTIKDNLHKVVVDFIEVSATDFGDYVLSMTSVSPVAKVTKANFTIFQSIAEQQGFTAAHAAVTAIGSILIIALVIVSIFMAKRMMNKQKTSDATVDNETPDAVVYNADVPDHHDYEDIEEKRRDETAGNGGNGGYVNMEIGQPIEQNAYTDEQNRTTQPSSNNANQRVAMKPPTRQNRMDQENPYIMPSVAGWQ